MCGRCSQLPSAKLHGPKVAPLPADLATGEVKRGVKGLSAAATLRYLPNRIRIVPASYSWRQTSLNKTCAHSQSLHGRARIWTFTAREKRLIRANFQQHEHVHNLTRNACSLHLMPSHDGLRNQTRSARTFGRRIASLACHRQRRQGEQIGPSPPLVISEEAVQVRIRRCPRLFTAGIPTWPHTQETLEPCKHGAFVSFEVYVTRAVCAPPSSGVYGIRVTGRSRAGKSSNTNARY